MSKCSDGPPPDDEDRLRLPEGAVYVHDLLAGVAASRGADRPYHSDFVRMLKKFRLSPT